MEREYKTKDISTKFTTDSLSLVFLWKDFANRSAITYDKRRKKTLITIKNAL